MHKLMQLAKKWLNPNVQSATEVVESMVMDQFLRALPIDAKRFVCQDNPNSPQEMEAVERFQASTDIMNSQPSNVAQSQQRLLPKVSSPRSAHKGDGPTKPMNLCQQQSPQVAKKNNLFASFLGGGGFQAMICPVSVNSQDVEALLDSGSGITLAHKSLVNPQQVSLETPVPVFCEHGDMCTYPTSAVTLVTSRGKYEIQTGVVDSLPVQVLIG